MSGIKYLLDTNAVISLLQGNPQLQHQLQQADWLGVSIISVVEYVSFPALTKNDKDLFFSFINRVQIVELQKHDVPLFENVALLKTKHRLKLPDAIIAASAMQSKAILITNDQHFKQSMLPIQSY